MQVLHQPPAGFQRIAKAFAMARLLPSSHQLNVRIGLARDGALFAAGHLDGYRQVNFFAGHLRELGWHEHLLGGGHDMHGCDMLFSHPADTSAQEEDPSFIRRTPVELWPSRGEA
jgi:hypothetical protein